MKRLKDRKYKIISIIHVIWIIGSAYLLGESIEGLDLGVAFAALISLCVSIVSCAMSWGGLVFGEEE